MRSNSSTTKYSAPFKNGLRLASFSTVDTRWILPFLLGVVIFTYSMSNMTSYDLSGPDILANLVSGLWIFEHNQVPTVDFFSHNTAGLKWLAQVIIAPSYILSEFYGLRILIATLFAVTIGHKVSFLLNQMQVNRQALLELFRIIKI
jgi:hypothetical protein